MNKFLFLYLALPCLLLSCSGNKNENTDLPDSSVYFPWACNDEQLSSLFEIEYIPLESHPDGLMKTINKMLIQDDKYYMLDYFGQNQINVFDREGKFLHTIGNKGQGPGEYLEARNFTIKDNQLYLLDLTLNKVLIYDLSDGTFIGDKKLPFYAHDMIVADNGDYIFAQQQIQDLLNIYPKENAYNVFITSPDMEVKHRLFPFHESHCGIRTQHNYFTLTDEHIVFHTMVADSLILFDRNLPSDIYKTYYFDFGPKTINRNYENDDEELMKYSYLYGTPFITSKYIIGNYWVGDGYGYEPFIYHLNEKKATVENDINSHYFFYPLLVVEDTIYASYDIRYFDNWNKYNNRPDLPENILEQLENGDDVLIKYSMK